MIPGMEWRSPWNRFDPVSRTLVGGICLLLASYVVVFMITPDGRSTWGESLIGALINVGALSFWGVLVGWLNLRVLLDRPMPVQAFAHPLIGLLFSVAWYFSVTVLLGWRAGDFSGAFSVVPFSYVAFVWQVFQGLTLYALIVALAVIRRQKSTPSTTPAPDSRRTRLLVRTEDEFVSVPVDDIVRIERAGDYAQLITHRGRHLTRRSLAELERQLPPERFLRVHRSHLIHLDKLESAESIGNGRLRAHLDGGMHVDTSRAGAKLLRERAG